MAEKEIQKREQDNARTRIRPRSVICEQGDIVVLRMEMPGVEQKDLDIRIEENELHVSGTRSGKTESGTALVRERLDGDFYRVFTLDDTIDRNRVEANLKNGMLHVTLHLKEAEKPRQIEVKSG